MTQADILQLFLDNIKYALIFDAVFLPLAIILNKIIKKK